MVSASTSELAAEVTVKRGGAARDGVSSGGRVFILAGVLRKCVGVSNGDDFFIEPGMAEERVGVPSGERLNRG